MYMERIETQGRTAARAKPKALKLIAGLLFLAVSTMVMVPWLVLVAAWVAVAGGFRALVRLARTIHDTLCYAGELVVGR